MDAESMLESSKDPMMDLQSRAAPIIECAPLPMVEVEGTDHTVCFANTAFCRLVRKNRDNIVGKPFESLVRNGDKCVPVLDKVYETGESKTHVEADHSEANPAYWLYAMWPSLGGAKSPERVVIQLTKAAHFRQDMAAMNAELLVAGLRQHELREAAEKANAKSQSDIAERILAEVALRGANANLRNATGAAQRANHAKDAFIAALSHELRTPLTPALIAAASLREDVRLPSDARAQAGMIERNISLEARLIDDLLDLTKITHGKLLLRPETCDVHSVIDLAVEILADEARDKKIVISKTFDARQNVLNADPARLQQVVWNLIRNAVKFSPNGSPVSIRTSEQKYPDGQMWLRIEVTDHGIGIDPSKLDQIFLPFEQGDRAGDHRFGGVGLGLAIARAVVIAHGGRLTAVSAGQNCGASFIVELPGTSGPSRVKTKTGTPSPTGLSTATAGEGAARPLRLLVVEDHPSTLQAMAFVLRRDGHHVIPAATAADALAAAASNTFDFVISDLGLPDCHGTELMTQLRATYGLEGIALTGYGMGDDLVHSREAGFVHHLVKPVSMAELRRVIASLPRPPTPD